MASAPLERDVRGAQSAFWARNRHAHAVAEYRGRVSTRTGAKVAVTTIGVMVLALLGTYLAWSHQLTAVDRTKNTYFDVGMLHRTDVHSIRRETTEAGLVDAVNDARRQGLKVAMAGSHHSQGGQSFYPDAVILDMTGFDRIVRLDEPRKLLTVQSGATWRQVQAYLAPRGLAVMRMQSSYAFTVGGTLSANAHGRDLSGSSVVESVRSFRLLLANGKVVRVSRTEHPDLFRLVIGGYGMFGVILDVTLQVVDDSIYEKRSATVDYRAFPAFFAKLQRDPTTKMMLVRPNIDPHSDRFLRDFVVSTWHSTDVDRPSLHRLSEEKSILRDRFFFDLSRRSDWAKSVRWRMQERLLEKRGANQLVSRNNAMRPPEAPFAFLDYRPKNRADLLTEYYIPTAEFVPFMAQVRQIVQADHTNVISSTIRFVHHNDEVDLAYAPEKDAFAVILMTNTKLDPTSVKATGRTTRAIMKAALQHGGTNYLTYQLFPTRQQVERAYPRLPAVFAAKKRWDPQELFMNEFYAHYAKGEEFLP